MSRHIMERCFRQKSFFVDQIGRGPVGRVLRVIFSASKLLIGRQKYIAKSSCFRQCSHSQKNDSPAVYDVCLTFIDCATIVGRR